MEHNQRLNGISTCPTRKPNRPQHICHCNIGIAGLICRRTCFNVSTDLINYILVQRDQTPESYDSLIKLRTAAGPEPKIQDELKRDSKTIRSLQVKHNGGIQKNISHNNLSLNNENNSSDNNDGCNSNANRSHFQYEYQYEYSKVDNSTTDPNLEDRCLKPMTFRKTGHSSMSRLIQPSMRRRNTSIDTASLIFSHLQEAFETSVFPIEKLAFSLGSSLVNPKETFVLSFPSNHIEGKNISHDIVKKTLFRELVTSDFIESFSQPGLNYSLQKLYILLLVNRSSGIRWFTPVPRYSLPSRGSLYYITLTNPSAKDASLCVSDDSMLEISGINAMDDSVGSMELSSPCPIASKRRRLLSTSFEEMCDTKDTIWYQAPVTFRGFK